MSNDKKKAPWVEENTTSAKNKPLPANNEPETPPDGSLPRFQGRTRLFRMANRQRKGR